MDFEESFSHNRFVVKPHVDQNLDDSEKAIMSGDSDKKMWM